MEEENKNQNQEIRNINIDFENQDPNTFLIQKSIPLILMEEVPFNFGELRILDLYLSLINSYDEKYSRVRIPLKQFCTIMGIKRPHKDRLSKSMDGLLSKKVHVPAKYAASMGETDFDEGDCGFTLFDVADFGKLKNGSTFVDLECSRRARKFFFNVNNIKYVKYTLGILLSLGNKYSILFYLYLLKCQFEKKKSWSIEINDFKEICFKTSFLGYYDEFKHFKQKILDPSISEVNQKTEFKVIYACKKNGRNVTELEFNFLNCDELYSEGSGSSSLDCKEKEEKPEEKGVNQSKQYVKREEPKQTQPLSARNTYSKDFEEFWKAYPRKQDKGMALDKYNACINAGYKPEELLTAARKYAEQCAMNHTEQRYIKMARTFLGPSHPFEEFLDAVLKEEPELTPEELEEEERIREQIRKRFKSKIPEEQTQGEEG